MELAALDKVWDAFITWQFATASLFIVAVMTTIKRTLRAFGPATLVKPAVVAALTAGNLLLGLVVAIPHGYLMGDSYFQRMFMGVVAGMFSNTLYHLVLKRFRAFRSNEPTKKPEPEDKLKAVG